MSSKKKIVKAEIISNKEIAPDHFVMELKAPYLGTNSTPGQFINVKVAEDVTDPLLRIPLGIHKITKQGISLLYKVVGKGTEILSLKKKKGVVDILGPLGGGFDLSHLPEKAILIAGGHGIAPLYALAEALLKKKIEVDFLIGVKEKNHTTCVDALRKLGADVYIATEDGSVGYKGYVVDLLKNHLKRVTNNESRVTIYACGPRPMLGALAKETKKSTIQTQVSLDAYMACGIGACLGCAIRTKNGYKLVCKDGPVFDAQEVEW